MFLQGVLCKTVTERSKLFGNWSSVSDRLDMHWENYFVYVAYEFKKDGNR